MDFSANLDSDYHRLQTLLEGLDIAILINNVGQSHSIPVAFAETTPQEMKDIITINCNATLQVTQLVLPGMIARKRGLILTMGSFAGLIPTPYLATYSGSKAFLQHWSTSLGAELSRFNISVELVQSYLVTSAMSKIRKPSVAIPTPKSFVKAVLARIGRSGGAQGWAYTSNPYWTHAVMQWALSTFTGLNNWIVVRQNMGMHEAIRRRALKKMEREALGGKKAS
jgi:17beta-estradiol 17-dehydrogenase / very-long-chain 3-oxoacyl-CoA reductase